jgi:Zinc carboxypeptidase
MFFFTLMPEAPALGPGAGGGGVLAVGRRFPQAETPPFWKGRLEDVDAAVASLKRGKSQVIARSPGRRPVYRVAYGTRNDFHRQANYSSAVGAGDPRYYARKPKGAPPVVLLIGPPHGQEMEGIVGLLNLLRVAETGKDWRGQEWPVLRANLDRCRVLIVPVANPDGRARCPYDSFVGIPADEMSRIGQGTRADGTLWGWPEVKQQHPMHANGGLLGAYFNDNGINLMHDEFFAPMAAETKALLQLARDEAPDYLLNLHSHGAVPEILATAYVPRYCKESEARFAARLAERYRAAGLPAGKPPVPGVDGEPLASLRSCPPPAFNLTSALHHVCGGLSMLFECPHGLKEPQYVQVTHEQILDLELLLFDELFALALETPRPAG